MSTSFVKRYGQQIAARDGGWYCHYCRCRLVPLGTPATDTVYFDSVNVLRPDGRTIVIHQLKAKFRLPTVDHLRAHSKGGDSTLNNLVLSCQDCNSKKSNLPVGQIWRGKRVRR